MSQQRRLKVLIIAQAFSPLHGSHATRVTELARGLRDLGCSVHVIATSLPLRFACSKDVDQEEDLLVHRGFVGPLHWLRYRMQESLAANMTDGNSLVRRLAIPDTFIEWLPGAVVSGLYHYIRCWRPDVIVSSAVPYTAHLAGAIIARVTSVPWLVDYGDPWVFDPGHPRRLLRGCIEYFMEQAVLKNARAVTVTTYATRELYLEKYKVLTEERVFVIPMAYQTNMFEIVKPTEDLLSYGSDALRLIYTGSIRSESRNIQPLLTALASSVQESGAVNQIRFHIMGSVDRQSANSIQSIALGNVVSFDGWVDKQRLARALLMADVAVLLGNNNTIQIPGKLYEYIGSGVPILYIRNHNQQIDECEAVLSKSGRTYWVISNDENSIKQWILYAFSHRMEIRARHQRGLPPLENHTWEARAKDFLKILLALTDCRN